MDGDLIADVSELMDKESTLLQLDSLTAHNVCESGRKSPIGKLVSDRGMTRQLFHLKISTMSRPMVIHGGGRFIQSKLTMR